MDNNTTSTTSSNISTSSGDWLDTQAIVYISAEAVNGVVSLVGNSIVVAAILRTPQLHTVTNVFIVSLALADVVVGFLVPPLAVSVYKSFYVNFYICILVNTTIIMFTNISILMLMAVAVERFLAISRPFTYVRVMTVKRAVVINVLIWLSGVVLGLVPMYGWHKSESGYTTCAFVHVIPYTYMVYFQFFGLVLVPLLIMLVIYIYILRVVHYHTARDNRHNSLFQNGGMTKKQKREFQKDVKAAKYFALIILLFAIFWLPVNIINSISLLWPEHFPPMEVLLVAIVLSHANSSINPFIYAASNTRIKRAMQIILHIPQARDDSELTDLPRDQRASSASLNGPEPTGQAGHSTTLTRAASPAADDEVTLTRSRAAVVTLTPPDNGHAFPHSSTPEIGKEDAGRTNVETTLGDQNKENTPRYAENSPSDQLRPEIVLGVNSTGQSGNALQTIRLVDETVSDSHTSVPPTKDSHKNLINGYLKHNQVHPLRDNLFQNKAGTVSNNKSHKHGGRVHWEADASKVNPLREDSGYYNLAFNPDPDGVVNDENKNHLTQNSRGTFSDITKPEEAGHGDRHSPQPSAQLETSSSRPSSQTEVTDAQHTVSACSPDSDQSQIEGQIETSDHGCSDETNDSNHGLAIQFFDTSQSSRDYTRPEDDVIVLEAIGDVAGIENPEENGDASNEPAEEWTFVTFSENNESPEIRINRADEWTKL